MLLLNIVSYVLKDVPVQERTAAFKELLVGEIIENEIVAGLIEDYGKEINYDE